ncbi:peptidoglycan DD-metalloendopeptidase family protein [Paraconexibacter algicola]|uniref:M23ase beta-sheet core domain-containing protein n=1 Tax=Paraconexibacter algicola TaxID=2133960 RepID=A0A2T4UKG7_9ACTN|nr:peptidoglycan DD-metalloendopeptidase family protein [Paraconexibacter algicola]PTL59720.1 hypothetical protein C7Y72_08670 [Paraconexibacter algicola]
MLALLATAAAAAPPPDFGVTQQRVRPARIFLVRDPVRIAFTPTGSRTLDLDVEIVAERDGTVARRLTVRAARPGREQVVRWDGVRGSGAAAPDGRYRVRVVAPAIGERRRLGTFTLRGHMYPIRGPHADRGVIGLFGVPRNGGRTHEGYDVNAPCGTRMVAARGGTVVRSRFDPVLYGHEVIVRGALDGRTYRYAHLRTTPRVRRGDRVRTGQTIGSVGDSGNARTTGCHLHFELRTRGGRLLDPQPFLHRWDRFS